MPIYEYKCKECGKITEKLTTRMEKDTENCNYCDGTSKRVISQSSIRFKGSGWYATDYADTSNSVEAEKNSPEPAKAKTPPQKSSGDNQ